MNKVLYFAAMTVLFLGNEVSAQTKAALFIPSEAAGSTGIAAEVTIPAKARYGTSAPVVIHLVGGTSVGDFSFGVNMAQYGCIEIRFIYPGGADSLNGQIVRSGGVYDTRGLNSLRALRDIVKFAQGIIADTKGKKLSDYTGTVKPLTTNVGLHGSSNGGNAAIALAGALGNEISNLAWIVNWESPVGDGVPNVDAGSKQTGLNPAYNTTTGQFDFTKLKYSDTLAAGVMITPGSRTPTTLRGSLYFDVNANGEFNNGDFKLSPRIDTVGGKIRAYFSNASLDAAYKANLFPSARPTHIPTLQENQDYWKYRNGEGWFGMAVKNIPGLMFTVVASAEDHVQIAPNYPHIITQYEGFRQAGARFVRLNGDRAYTEFVLGRALSTAADNTANIPFTYSTVRNALQPSGTGPNGLRSDFTIAGAILELADRTQTNNLTANLDAVLSVPTTVQRQATIENIRLSMQPNPAFDLATVCFTLSKPGRVSLKLFNALGQEIIEILNSELAAGEYRHTFDISNVAEGVYILQLARFSQTATQYIHIIR